MKVSNTKPQGWVYDLETLKNCFTGVWYNILTKEVKSFVIHSGQDNRIALYEYLEHAILNNDMHLGYNNLFFDGPIINFIIDNKEQIMNCTASSAANLIYNKAQNIISSNKTSYNIEYHIRQLDVFKLMHYDRRMVSLKTLQGSMRWYQMQDMPIHHSTEVDAYQIEGILDYNINDVMSTYSFYTKIKTEIDLRKTISRIYGFDALNMNSTKIGETIFINALTKATGYTVKQLSAMVKKNQIVDVKDVIFDRVKLTEEPFINIYDYLKKQKVTELKGFFTNIPINENEQSLLRHMSKNKDYYNKKTQTITSLNVVHYDNTFVIGSGGVHSTHNTIKIFKSDKSRILIDLDKESWYPLLCIKNNWFPEHLGPAFLDVYSVLFDDRKLYKVIALQDKSNIDANTIQKALKLSLVSVYGKLGSEYSPLNCSKTQLGICINGQLLLMQCIERVMQRSKAANYKAELIFSNTDGFMVSIDRGYLEELKKVAAELSDETEILLEYEECDAMYMRDVNNFINIKADGSVKLKGAYEIDKDFHKNGSTRIVSIAAANYFINEISPEDTIKNHLKRSKLGRLINNDYEIYYSKKHNNKVVSHGIYDFMILKKIDSRFQFKQVDKRGNTTDLQKSIRYLMTTTGCKLIKQTVASKKIALLEATKTSYEQVFNEMPDCKLESQEMMCFEKSIPINYNHYIKQAYKLIHSIEGYGEQLLF